VATSLRRTAGDIAQLERPRCVATVVKMRATTIRFSPSAWELIEREAHREGVSVAQYVREATLFNVAYRLGERGEGLADMRALLADELREFSVH
jgi:hypothetical protein